MCPARPPRHPPCLLRRRTSCCLTTATRRASRPATLVSDWRRGCWGTIDCMAVWLPFLTAPIPRPRPAPRPPSSGLSQFFRAGRSFHSLVGSAFYVAPEVLRRNYGPPADVRVARLCGGCEEMAGDSSPEQGRPSGCVGTADVPLRLLPPISAGLVAGRLPLHAAVGPAALFRGHRGRGVRHGAARGWVDRECAVLPAHLLAPPGAAGWRYPVLRPALGRSSHTHASLLLARSLVHPLPHPHPTHQQTWTWTRRPGPACRRTPRTSSAACCR